MTKEIRKILLFEIQFQFFINFYHFDLSNFLFQSIYLMKRIVNNFEKKKEGWKIISPSNLNLKFIILLPDSRIFRFRHPECPSLIFYHHWQLTALSIRGANQRTDARFMQNCHASLSYYLTRHGYFGVVT